ncbi:MAG: CPBP family intramembrane metalloprotease [Acidobacteriota bacterium]|jgi:membrane protease YdiL (CAAX protease family)|nr:CPBP family intramembrane metalloprotease [Acidobacteriota bacterium]
MNRLLAYSPNLKQSWMLTFIIIASSFVEVLASRIIQYTGAATPEWAELSGMVLSYAVLAPIVVRLGKGDSYAPAAGPGLPPLLWFLLVPFALSIGLLTKPLTAWIPMPDILIQMMAEVFQSNLSTFLKLVVIAPLCEEWLFRGIILKGLLARYSPLKGIIWSAVIFGAMHINPWQFVPAFFLALAAGWIYWRTRSLWICIFMHAVINAFAFLFMFLFPDAPDNTTIADIINIHYVYVYLAVLAVGALSWAGIKHIISSKINTDMRR